MGWEGNNDASVALGTGTALAVCQRQIRKQAAIAIAAANRTYLTSRTRHKQPGAYVASERREDLDKCETLERSGTRLSSLVNCVKA
jgi:hypothetical protein